MKLQVLKCSVYIRILCTITDVNVYIDIWIVPLTFPSGVSCEAKIEAENVSSMTVSGPPTQRTEPRTVQEMEGAEISSQNKDAMAEIDNAYNRCYGFFV